MFVTILKNKLLWIALLPPFILLLYIYGMDKKDRESPLLLARVFLNGVISCIPAVFFEFLGEYILKNTVSENDGIYIFAEAFFVVAFTEEFFKYLAVNKITRNNYEFNYRFDGIVYAVFSSLGFASVENVMYVFNYGFETGVFRALLAIPGHMMFGVFMGVFYGKCKECILGGRKISAVFFDVLAVTIPVVLHGTYDYLLLRNTRRLSLIFLCFAAAAYVFTFYLIRFYSRNDYNLFRGHRRS